MKERGGGRVWEWKTAHLKKRAVELGLEDMSEDDSKQPRKKRRAMDRTKSFPNPDSSVDLNRTGSTNPNVGPEDAQLKMEFDSEREQQLIDQILREDPDMDTVDDASSCVAEVQEPRDTASEPEEYQLLNHDQSQQVADQACHELVHQQQQHLI